jgi:hypothetical protein
MVIPAAGAVVLVRFPFSDLSQAKLRPAVVLADAGLPALPPRVPPRVLAVAGQTPAISRATSRRPRTMVACPAVLSMADIRFRKLGSSSADRVADAPVSASARSW